MPNKREWSYRRSDADCEIRASYIDAELKQRPKLRKSWPTPRKARGVSGMGEGGSNPATPAPRTAGACTRECNSENHHEKNDL